MNPNSQELMNWITHQHGLMAGRPTIRRQRFPVADILELLASDLNINDILAQHPELEKEDVIAALCYAASNIK